MALLKWKVADANCGESAKLANLIAGAALGNSVHRFDDTKTVATFCAEFIEIEKETLTMRLDAMKEIVSTLNQNQRYIDGLNDESSVKDVVRVLKRTHKNMTKAVNIQSMPATNPPTTAAGSCGRGWIGGGTTN